MSLKEAQFQKQLRNKLDKIDNCYYFVKEAKAIRGIPDIVGCLNGHFFAMEVKRSQSEARKNTGRIVLQKYTLQRIDKAHGIGYLVYPENIQEVLDDLLMRCNRKSFLVP